MNYAPIHYKATCTLCGQVLYKGPIATDHNGHAIAPLAAVGACKEHGRDAHPGQRVEIAHELIYAFDEKAWLQ